MLLEQKLVVLAAVVALVVGGHACSRSAATPSPTPPLPPTPIPIPTPIPTSVDPLALLIGSGGVMEEVDSFHFRLDHRSGATALIPGLLIKEAEGSVVKPDKLTVEFRGTFGGFAVKSSLVTLGAGSYMTNPLTGEWESLPTEVNPLGFFDPRRGITSMMTQIEQVALLSSDAEVYRLKGKLSAEALAPLVGKTVEGTTVGVEITIDARDLYLLEAIFDGRVTPSEPDGTVRVITLSRFGEPVTIKPPE